MKHNKLESYYKTSLVEGISYGTSHVSDSIDVETGSIYSNLYVRELSLNKSIHWLLCSHSVAGHVTNPYMFCFIYYIIFTKGISFLKATFAGSFKPIFAYILNLSISFNFFSPLVISHTIIIISFLYLFITALPRFANNL